VFYHHILTRELWLQMIIGDFSKKELKNEEFAIKFKEEKKEKFEKTNEIFKEKSKNSENFSVFW